MQMLLPALGRDNPEKPLFMDRRFWVLFLFFATLRWADAQSLALPQPELPEWMHGYWEGRGYQTNTNTQWQTLLSYFRGDENPEVRYPDLGCEGYWSFRQSGEFRLVFQEIIVRNSGKCSHRDWIYVEPQGWDTLLVRFAHVWAPEEVIATAKLVRRSLP